MDDSSFPHYLKFPFQSIFNCPYQKEIPTLLYLNIQPSCRIYMYKLGLVLELKYYWKIQWHESDVTDNIYTFLSIRIPYYWYKMYTVVFHCSVLSASSDWDFFCCLRTTKNVKRTEFYLFHYSLIQIKYIKWLTPLFHPFTPWSA